MERPNDVEVSTDPIRGTDEVRIVMERLCPWCGENLELTSRQPWKQDCPECTYSWMPGLVE